MEERIIEESQRRAYEDGLESALNFIGKSAFLYEDLMVFAQVEKVYRSVEAYCEQNALLQSAIVIRLLRGLYDRAVRERMPYDAAYIEVDLDKIMEKQEAESSKSESLKVDSEGSREGGSEKMDEYQSFYSYRFGHTLSLCRMLIDLQVPISLDEEDILLASTMCYDMLKVIPMENMGEKLFTRYQLDMRIYDIIKLISRQWNAKEVDKEVLYQQIQKDKLALLIVLTSRGDLVQQLYGMTIWKAREYVHDTRVYFLPMCHYAKQHYGDIFMVVNILMEKIRCLIEVTDILTSRYQQREMALMNEMLSLQEENARFRGMITKLEGEYMI